MILENEFDKLLQKNFIVVGNGKQGLNGKFIDSHDVVIRFNDYKIEGYEEYVGTKTNIWFRATNDAVLNTLDEKNSNNYDLIIIRAKSERNTNSIIYYNKVYKPYMYLPSIYEKDLTSLVGHIPSTGLLCSYYIYTKFSNLYIKNFLGFDFCEDNPAKIVVGRPVHYFSKKNSYGFLNSKHNWIKEKKFFEGLFK